MYKAPNAINANHNLLFFDVFPCKIDLTCSSQILALTLFPLESIPVATVCSKSDNSLKLLPSIF